MTATPTCCWDPTDGSTVCTAAGRRSRWSAARCGLASTDAPAAPTPAQVAAVEVGFDRDLEHMAEMDRLFSDSPPPPDGRYTTGEGAIHEALLADPAAFRERPDRRP